MLALCRSTDAVWLKVSVVDWRKADMIGCIGTSQKHGGHPRSPLQPNLRLAPVYETDGVHSVNACNY
jgi:hypothetical protein